MNNTYHHEQAAIALQTKKTSPKERKAKYVPPWKRAQSEDLSYTPKTALENNFSRQLLMEPEHSPSVAHGKIHFLFSKLSMREKSQIQV
mmetsp:Transcript_41063/g.64233  ORF Transcript_41063/g.64233 Transcript_41063/m.64233 type:complete len:89 (+) Transcript_41063:170-436(+)